MYEPTHFKCNLEIKHTPVTYSFDKLCQIEINNVKKFENYGFINAAAWSVIATEKHQEYANKNQSWIAEISGEPIGFVVVDLYGEYVHIEELDVAINFQYRGVGQALLNTIILWANAQQCHCITLRTFKTTPWSINLYSKLGFQISPTPMPHIAEIISSEQTSGLPTEDRVTMSLTVCPILENTKSAH